MGLFSTTVINSTSTTNVVVDNSELVEATLKVAKETGKLVKSTDRLADRVGDDRIRISHARYTELNNKEEALVCIKKYVKDLITETCRAIFNPDNSNYISSLAHLTINDRTLYFNSELEDVLLIFNCKTKAVDLHKTNDSKSIFECNFNSSEDEDSRFEAIEIDIQNIMTAEDGEVEMSGLEYKKAISREKELDEVYSKIRKPLTMALYNISNPNDGYILQNFKNNIINRNLFTTELDGFVFEFDEYGINIKKGK